MVVRRSRVRFPSAALFYAQKDHKQQIVYFKGRFFITDKRNRAADGRSVFLIKIQNLVLFDLFICITGNKMINEKIDRMLLCLDDFLECFIFFCQTGDFSFAIHIHLPFYTIQIDTSYMFYVKKYSLKCQDNKDVCGETLLLY